MKYSIGILTTVTLFAAFILTGCDNPSHKMEDAEVSLIEANRNMDIAKSEVEAELQIYRVRNADRIMGYNRTIDEIQKKINNESDMEVRERLETKLDGYEATHRELKHEMDNYRVSGRENWDNFKNSFSNRMDDLGNSLDDFFSPSGITSSSNQP